VSQIDDCHPPVREGWQAQNSAYGLLTPTTPSSYDHMDNVQGDHTICAVALYIIHMICLSLKPVMLNQPANEIKTMLLGKHFTVFDLFSDVIFHIDKPRGVFF
jgi:hypothetical protein